MSSKAYQPLSIHPRVNAAVSAALARAGYTVLPTRIAGAVLPRTITRKSS